MDLVLESITYNVYPGIQNLNFNFILPIGNDYQLGVNGNNSGYTEVMLILRHLLIRLIAVR